MLSPFQAWYYHRGNCFANGRILALLLGKTGTLQIKTKSILIIIFLSFIGLKSIGQVKKSDTSTSNLYFAYGQAYNIKIDRTYSRLAKNGFNHLFNLGYENLKNNRAINVDGSFMIGTLKTKGNDINFIDNYSGNLKLRYLKKIKEININNLSIYAGGNINFRGDVWFPQNSELRYAWDINLGIGLATSILYKINPKLFFQYNLDFSLLGILWRSHNNGQQLITEEIQLERGFIASAFETPRFSHMLNTLYIDNSLKLFYAISEKINLYYNYTLSFGYMKQPLIKKGYEFNNALGIIYKF